MFRTNSTNLREENAILFCVGMHLFLTVLQRFGRLLASESVNLRIPVLSFFNLIFSPQPGSLCEIQKRAHSLFFDRSGQ